MEHIDKLLKSLTLATGVGYSGNVKDVILQELQRNSIEAHITADGSVHGVLNGQRDTSIMIACHIDEVGFMLSSIDDQGRISFSEVGNVDVRILPGQEVVVHGNRELRGYIGAKPPHLVGKDERKKVIPIEKLFVDTGLSVDEVKNSVKVGDCISFFGMYRKLQGNFRSVKSLDNRSSVACGILVLKELSKIEDICNVHFVATSLEEYYGLGARIHSYRLPIQYAVVIDATFGEHPDLMEHECFSLNGGPVIGRGSTIPEEMSESLVQIARGLDMAYQVEAMVGATGTDADNIAFNRDGIPTCVVGIPLRYMHTPVEVVSLTDIENTKRLVVSYIKQLARKHRRL